MKSSSVTIQMKANEQRFIVVLLTVEYKQILTLASMDQIL